MPEPLTQPTPPTDPGRASVRVHPSGAAPRMPNVVSLDRHRRRHGHDRSDAPREDGSAPMSGRGAAVLRFDPDWGAAPPGDVAAAAAAASAIGTGFEGFDDHDDETLAPDQTGAESPATAGATAPPAPDDAALAALLGRVATQDARALEALYDATAGRVHGLVLRIVQRRAWAEEAVEDTFWQVWRQAARFDPVRGRPLTWLLAIARSRAIDLLRREQRFRHESLDAEADDGGEHGRGRSPDNLADADAAPPQDLLDATRDGTRLHAALATLDARARQLLALAFFRGLTHDEIAAQEQMPLGSVKSVIRRALIQLRQTLEADHDA